MFAIWKPFLQPFDARDILQISRLQLVDNEKASSRASTDILCC
jgi:hypothetical protein